MYKKSDARVSEKRFFSTPDSSRKSLPNEKRVLIICFIGTRFHYLLTRFICVARFSSKHQSFLFTRFLSLLTKFTFMLTRYLTMLTRYAKLVYKFYFTSTVDFFIYFYACNFKRIYSFELQIFLLKKLHG